MRRLCLSAVAALVAATVWTAGVSAQERGPITAEELARHGYNVPPPNVMMVVIHHTGSYQYAVHCVIHSASENLKQELKDTIEPGGEAVVGVSTEQMGGKLWVQCFEEAEGRSYASNNFSSAGRTIVFFNTGSKFIVQQNIVP